VDDKKDVDLKLAEFYCLL